MSWGLQTEDTDNKPSVEKFYCQSNQKNAIGEGLSYYAKNTTVDHYLDKYFSNGTMEAETPLSKFSNENFALYNSDKGDPVWKGHC